MIEILGAILIALAVAVVIGAIVTRGPRKPNWPDDYPDGWN